MPSRALITRSVRPTVALATVFALLLPLPARCVACSTSNDRCPHCIAAKADADRSTDDAPGACCKHPSMQPAASIAHASVDLVFGRHTCGCSFSANHRTLPTVDKTPTFPEQSAGLFQVAFVPPALPAVKFANSDGYATALPPPVPHRILHCSWII